MNHAKKHPVIIIDEPHKFKGEKFNEAFKDFKDSISIRFGATYPFKKENGKKEKNERVISLTKREITELLEKSSGHLKDAIMIAINTGMRRGEILSLKWTQINFETRFISLEATQTKGKTRRDIPMTDTLYDYLLNLRRGKLKHDHVIQYQGERILKLKNSWNTLRKKLSFEIKINEMPLRFHDLRHCYATYLRMSGANLSDIQYLLGHKDMKTT